MKLQLLLTTLLLSTPPVLANEFLYMMCRTDTNVKVSDLPTGEITDDQDMEEWFLFQVDLTNKKLRNHINPAWVDVRMEGDQIIQDTTHTNGNKSAHNQGSLPLNPPGPISIHNQWRIPPHLRVVKSEGECREIDSSTWDEGVEQFGTKEPSSGGHQVSWVGLKRRVLSQHHFPIVTRASLFFHHTQSRMGGVLRSSSRVSPSLSFCEAPSSTSSISSPSLHRASA